MNLFGKNRLKNVRYENQIKSNSIMNDYHSPKTNGGFSRSKIGGIYYKWSELENINGYFFISCIYFYFLFTSKCSNVIWIDLKNINKIR